MKFACDCGQVATWVNAPGFSSGDNPYFCDDCVPRGCSCNHESFPGIEVYDGIDIGSNPEQNQNFKMIEENKRWTPLDDKNREYPCVEYFYEELGYDALEEYKQENKNYKFI